MLKEVGGVKKKKKEDVSDQLEDASLKRASFYQEFQHSSKRSFKKEVKGARKVPGEKLTRLKVRTH